MDTSTLDRRRSHVVISAPSQWGQQGCFHLLHRAIAHGGRITMIIPRRHERLFATSRPSIEQWADYASLKECLESLRAAGRPVDYVYDDHLNHLAVELISQRRSGSHLTVGYVTSSAEDHLAHASFLSDLCDRVLVEKPVSRIYSEIHPDGPFSRLVQASRNKNCVLKTAEHYLFRPGVTQVWSIAHSRKASSSDSLNGFLQRHRRCNLHYEFHFVEKAGRDDPVQRLGSYQDGSILDVLAPHGLGPVARLLLPLLGVADSEIDFYRDLTCDHVRSWQANDAPGESLKVPVLAETAAELAGRLELPGRDQTIFLTLRSAKGCRGFLRFFKISCPVHTCRTLRPRHKEELARNMSSTAGRGDLSLFCGVSLGAAGSTILDYFPGTGTAFWERDGGYRSDTRGGNNEAANAQAAMLDALLLAQEFEAPHGRFVPVESACQIVRFGLKVQGITSCYPRSYYPWGGEEPAWEAAEASFPDGSPVHRTPGKVHLEAGSAPQPPKDFEPGVEQVAAVLGLGPQGLTAPPYHKLVTVLGPEGAGNTDVALTLFRQFKGSCPISFLDVPRDEDWDVPRAKTKNEASIRPSRFTLDMVLRQLASGLGLPLTTAQRPAEALPRYLRRVKNRLPEAGIILLNGVDRLPDENWRVLARILNELPPLYRILIVTKRWDRAAGFVVRTEELLRSPEFQHLGKSRLDHFFQLFTRRLGQRQTGVFRDHYNLLRTGLHQFARGNLTLEQQASSYVMYIAVPAALSKVGPLSRDLLNWWEIDIEHLKWPELGRLLNQEVESLDLPRPLVPNPEALLDRISKLCLAMIGEEERAAIRSLAVISGYLYSEIVDEALPGLFHKIRRFQPVRSLFERVEARRNRALLFPRVRRAALTCGDDELAEIRSEVERRRLILSLRTVRRVHRDTPIVVQQLQETQIRLFYGTSLGHLNLDGSSFEQSCTELIEPLETSSDLQGDQAAGSLIELLTEGSDLRKTNLGLLTRAKLARLKGWLLRSSAGTDPARLHEAMNLAWTSYYLADFCARQEKEGEKTLEQRRREKASLVLTIQGVVFSGLVHSRCWERLFGLHTSPWPADQQWEKFVHPEHAGQPSDWSLWDLCAVDPATAALSTVAEPHGHIRAPGLRALALYLGSHPETRADPVWRRRSAMLLLHAAKLNTGRAEDCRARDLMEAALLLDETDSLVNPENRNRRVKAKGLRSAAQTCFQPLRKNHPGLAPYMDLLNMVLKARSGLSATVTTREELDRLEDEFELTGEVYFAHLIREMKRQRQPPGL